MNLDYKMGSDMLTNFFNSFKEGITIGIGISIIGLILSLISLLRNIMSERAKLHLEYDANHEPNTFCPAHNFGGFEQKFLRVRVRNSGWGIATNCIGYIHVPVSKIAESANYPSTELKPLTFGRAADKSDLSPPKQIFIPKLGMKYCM